MKRIFGLCQGGMRGPAILPKPVSQRHRPENHSTASPDFLCPECGSCQAAFARDPVVRPGLPRYFICAQCHLRIPAHLAQRWGGISPADAIHEWQSAYRNLNQDTPAQ